MERPHCLGLKALFIKINFQKYYEGVEWPFILDRLQALGFGPMCVQPIGTLFVNSLKWLLVN
jgi:hypothetical protein